MIQRIFIICSFYTTSLCNDPQAASDYNGEILQQQSYVQTANPKDLTTTSHSQYQRIINNKPCQDDDKIFAQQTQEKKTRVKFAEQPSLKNNIWIPLILFVITLVVLLIPIIVHYLINKSYERTHKEMLQTETNILYNPQKFPIFEGSDPDQVKIQKAYKNAVNLVDR